MTSFKEKTGPVFRNYSTLVFTSFYNIYARIFQDRFDRYREFNFLISCLISICNSNWSNVITSKSLIT